MRCETFTTGAIVCGSRKPKTYAPNCEVCGTLKPTIQCDYPVERQGKLTTCNRWCCTNCAVEKGPNVHWCQPHQAMGPPKL